MARYINHFSDRPRSSGKRVTAICGMRVVAHKIVTRTPKYPYPSCVGCKAIMIERDKEAAETNP